MLHPEEVLDALKAVSGDARYGQIMKQLTKKEKEEGVKMCAVAEKLEKIGIEKGMQEGRRQGMQEGIHQNMLQVICNMLRKNRSEEEILELTECSREVLEEARALLQDEC